MATRSRPAKPLGIFFDIFLLLLAAGAAAAFVPAYSIWTEDREYGTAQMECLRNADSDCFLKSYNQSWSRARFSSPGAFPEGRWMWTLRFMKTTGTLEDRIDTLMRTPSSNMSRHRGNVIESYEVDKLLSVRLSLEEFGLYDQSDRFTDAVLAKYKELYTGPLDYRPRFAGIPSQTPTCGRGEVDDHTQQLVASAGEVNLTKMRRSACWFIFFSSKSDDEVQAFINANLDEIQDQYLGQGKVVFPKSLYNLEEEMSFMDTMAFMAALLEFRANPDKSFGIN